MTVSVPLCVQMSPFTVVAAAPCTHSNAARGADVIGAAQYVHPMSPQLVTFSTVALGLKLGLVLAVLFFTQSAWVLAIVPVVVGCGLVAASVRWTPYFRVHGPPLPALQAGPAALGRMDGSDSDDSDDDSDVEAELPALLRASADPAPARAGNRVRDRPQVAPSAVDGEAEPDVSPRTQCSCCLPACRCCVLLLRRAMIAAYRRGGANVTTIALNVGVLWVYVPGAARRRRVVSCHSHHSMVWRPGMCVGYCSWLSDHPAT